MANVITFAMNAVWLKAKAAGGGGPFGSGVALIADATRQVLLITLIHPATVVVLLEENR